MNTPINEYLNWSPKKQMFDTLRRLKTILQSERDLELQRDYLLMLIDAALSWESNIENTIEIKLISLKMKFQHGLYSIFKPTYKQTIALHNDKLSGRSEAESPGAMCYA